MVLDSYSVQCHPGLTHIFNFWRSGTLAHRAECRSAQMSEIQNVGKTWMAKCNLLTPLPFKGLSTDPVSAVDIMPRWFDILKFVDCNTAGGACWQWNRLTVVTWCHSDRLWLATDRSVCLCLVAATSWFDCMDVDCYDLLVLNCILY